MLDNKQVRAARALLDWSQETLANVSGVARATIKNVENGSTFPRAETSQSLQKAFEDAGVEFLPGSGVRIRDRMVMVFDGKDAGRLLLDDVYETMRDIGSEVLIAGVNEKRAIEDLDEAFLTAHIERLNKAKVKERMIICKGDTNFTVPLNCYRCVDEKYFNPFPLYIYGPKLALVSWAPARRCVIVHDEAFAESVRRLFNFVWDRSELPTVPETVA